MAAMLKNLYEVITLELIVWLLRNLAEAYNSNSSSDSSKLYFCVHDRESQRISDVVLLGPSARLTPMQILVSIGTLAAFFDGPVLHTDPTPRSNRGIDFYAYWLKLTTCFCARMVLFGVRTMGDYISGEIYPQNSAKMGVNRQFQAKTAKYKNHNISETINRIRT